ncbi:MAG: pilus assembly protein N-terminal domain-containing protein [Erysipelotrichaceae bacterium]|nr:pilus assembly protein N-terminal domain-containing protein [Erysipelotrichaceae bacterium]
MNGNKERNTGNLINKIFGGLNMSWPVVILYAIGTAILTSVFLILPVFKDTSFRRMGVYMEAWIFFAVIIMANCKKPLESALKTFVFFLISQPLIYLFQVPFNWQGWGIFRYYFYWFIWTLLTFPMAYIGWYIGKKNWLSLLILSPVLAFLGYTIIEAGRQCLQNFPYLLVTVLFCILQTILYVLAFLSDWKQRIIGILIPVITIVVLAMMLPQVDLQVVDYLPDHPVFETEPIVEVADESICQVQVSSLEEGTVYIYAHKYGTTKVTISEGNKVLRYSFEVYNDKGVSRVRMTPIEP